MNPDVTEKISSTQDTSEAGDGSPSGNSSPGIADTVSGVVSQIQDHVGPAVSQTQQKAGELAGKVQEKAASRLDEQKSQAAGSLGSVAQALRQSSQQVREQNQDAVSEFAGKYGDVVADQVEHVSQYLQDRSVQDIVREVEDFGRREPALFLGGAFLLGLLGARLLKSAPASNSTSASPPRNAASRPATPEASSPEASSQGESTANGENGQGASLLPVSVVEEPYYESEVLAPSLFSPDNPTGRGSGQAQV